MLGTTRSALCSRSLLKTARVVKHAKPRLSRADSSSAPEYMNDLRTFQEISRWEPSEDIATELLEEMEFDDDDTTSPGHYLIDQSRDHIKYMRLIENDMPKLVAFRKAFVPPRASTPLIIRSLYYAGEKHPVENKRSIVVAVDHLPLKNDQALHRLKVLAGPRWTPRPPTNGGVSGLDVWNNGYIQISCENFPTGAMNLKWASDALDALVAAANNPKMDKLDRVPVDTRHFDSRMKKKKKGAHRYTGRQPSILDFPQEWLPEEKTITRESEHQ